VPESGRARAFVAGTIVAGTAAIVASAFGARGEEIAVVALLCAAAIIAELFQVSSDESSLDPIDAPTVSFSSSVHIGAVLIAGPWTAPIIAVVGVLVADGLRQAPLRRLAFNAAGFALATLAGGLAFELLGGRAGDLRLPQDLVAVAALALVYTAVNTFLVTTIVSLLSNARFGPLLRDTAAGEVPVVAAEAGLGFAFAALALADPWYVVALVPLLVAVYQAHANLVFMRRETGRALETFANVVDERDPYTYRHSTRVADYVTELAERLGLPGSEIARLRWAGRLHDLGKVSVDSAILGKKGKLDAADWAALRRHPRLSARLLGRFRFAAREARAVEYHHERYDGAGYYGIDAGRLPIAAHFLSVADSFDAMTSDRPYRRSLPEEHALAEIEAGLGTQFHPAAGKAFVAYRRGLDPTTVLSRDELAELRRPSLARRAGHPSVRKPTPSEVLLAAVLLTLLGVGTSSPLVTVVGAAVAAVAIVVCGLSSRRLRRSRRTLVAAVGSRPDITHFAEALAAETTLRWAGLLRWREDTLAGVVESSWGSPFAAPNETALTSWLVREIETRDPILLASVDDVGTPGAHAALPLRSGERIDGFLVLVADQPLPRYLQLALAATGDEIGDALLGPDRESDRSEIGEAAAI
jgi:HD-GYP domain-containing protein (c-di-GMP phosphodiesterase class II)